jgi:hypothetical protein
VGRDAEDASLEKGKGREHNPSPDGQATVLHTRVYNEAKFFCRRQKMWAVRELTVADVVGNAPMALAREHFQLIRKKWPKLNVKLLTSHSIASDKVYFVTEHKSLADSEQWDKAYWADDDVKNLVKRQNQLAKENGGRHVYTPWRDLFFYDASEEELK